MIGNCIASVQFEDRIQVAFNQIEKGYSAVPKIRFLESHRTGLVGETPQHSRYEPQVVDK